MSSPHPHGVPPVVPRPIGDLAPLLAWLRAGSAAETRVDFPAGTVLPGGRLDLCKQDLGPRGAAMVADALRPNTVRHLLLGTDGLGDDGALIAARAATGIAVETLYLGCNGITPRGAAHIADLVRASPQALSGVWLKRNPLGAGGGAAASAIVEAGTALRSLDLVQTGLTPPGLAVLTETLIAAHRAGRGLDRLYVGGNALGPQGASSVAALIAEGAVGEIFASADGFGDEGAGVIADALSASSGGLTRLSLASNGIGPEACARLVAASAAAGVEALDLGRVPMAGTLGAPDNRVDDAAASAIAGTLSAVPHGLTRLVLADTGLTGGAARALLDGQRRAVTRTRFLLGKGVPARVKRELNELAAGVVERPAPAAVAAIASVHRTV